MLYFIYPLSFSAFISMPSHVVWWYFRKTENTLKVASIYLLTGMPVPCKIMLKIISCGSCTGISLTTMEVP